MIENRLPDYLNHMLEATKLACCYVVKMVAGYTESC